jgi:hypothetical protein
MLVASQRATSPPSDLSREKMRERGEAGKCKNKPICGTGEQEV